MEERRSKWVPLTQEEMDRLSYVEELFSERTSIQRRMSACTNLLSEEYRQLQQELRENSAKLASA